MPHKIKALLVRLDGVGLLLWVECKLQFTRMKQKALIDS